VSPPLNQGPAVEVEACSYCLVNGPHFGAFFVSGRMFFFRGGLHQPLLATSAGPVATSEVERLPRNPALCPTEVPWGDRARRLLSLLSVFRTDPTMDTLSDLTAKLAAVLHPYAAKPLQPLWVNISPSSHATPLTIYL